MKCALCGYIGEVEEFESRAYHDGCDTYTERKCPKCGQWSTGTGGRAPH